MIPFDQSRWYAGARKKLSEPRYVQTGGLEDETHVFPVGTDMLKVVDQAEDGALWWWWWWACVVAAAAGLGCLVASDVFEDGQFESVVFAVVGVGGEDL